MGFAPLPNGQEVEESAIRLTNTSGLHDALALDELELELGERIRLTLDCEVRKLTFEPIDKDDLEGPVRRVTGLHVLVAAQLDTDEVRERLAQQSAKVAAHEAAEKARKAAEKGQLPLGSPEAAGELCAHDLDPAECTDCVPLPLEPEPDAAEARNGLHAVTG